MLPPLYLIGSPVTLDYVNDYADVVGGYCPPDTAVIGGAWNADNRYVNNFRWEPTEDGGAWRGRFYYEGNSLSPVTTVTVTSICLPIQP
ncbi:hypothetical protein [Nonomuraea sp. NPDC002799]